MSTNANDAPRSAEDLKAYARDRMRAIIDKYKAEGGVFTDQPDKSTGLIYRSAGAISLLLLVNGFDDLAHENSWSDIVTTEFEKVCEHVATKGFDASPLKRAPLFSPDGPYYYLDSVSWVLSFALQLRLAQLNKKIALGVQLDSVNAIVRRSLEILRDSACETGGWGFTKGVTKPDLYYSYAVSESLADFGDYVMGESKDEIGIGRDDDLIEHLGKDLIDQIQAKRRLTAKWLINEYLPTLGTSEVDPQFEKDTKKKPHILLYYSYFVIDMLIVNLPDSFLTDPTDDFFKQEENRINRGIEHAIYLSRIDFDKARDTGDEWWGDYRSSSLELSWEGFEQPALLGREMDPARTQLLEPGLVPLSLRCNALYAFYVAKGADTKMSNLFEILHKNRDPETGLWDTESYSLMVTERAIEALVDYNDYLRRHESGSNVPRPPIPIAESESLFRSCVNAAVREIVGSDGELQLLLSQRQSDKPIATEPDRNALLGSIVTALDRGLKASKGEATDVEPFTYNQFRREIRDVLDDIVVDAISGLNPDKDKQNLLESQYRTNKDALLKAIASWFLSDPANNGGDLLQWLIRKVAESQKRGTK
jgi:hypothetical protein